MNNERIKFWLSRDLEEQTMQLNVIAERISVLNHQSRNFDMMSSPLFQEQTVRELIKDLEYFRKNSNGLKWKSSIKEMKKEIGKE